MHKFVIGVVGVVIVAVVGFWLLNQQRSAATETAQEGSLVEATGEVREFTIVGGNYYYSIPEIRIGAGDAVRVTFSSEEGLHDFIIDEFGVATEILREGDAPQTIEFVANKTGEFEYYCSVGQHRALGQVGRLIVEATADKEE